MVKWIWRFLNFDNALWVRVVKSIHGLDGGILKTVYCRYGSIWLEVVNSISILKEKGINLMSFFLRTKLDMVHILLFGMIFGCKKIPLKFCSLDSLLWKWKIRLRFGLRWSKLGGMSLFVGYLCKEGPKMNNGCIFFRSCPQCSFYD